MYMNLHINRADKDEACNLGNRNLLPPTRAQSVQCPLTAYLMRLRFPAQF